MPDSTLTTRRRIWRRIWHHRFRYWLLAVIALTLAGVEVGTGQVLDTGTGLTSQV